jgi:hypothetical protein
VQRRGLQQEAELLACDQPGLEMQPLLDSHLEIEEGVGVVLLAAKRDVLAVGPVVEQLAPVDRKQVLLDPFRRQARGIEPTHHRPHAGADDEVHRNLQLLQHP